MASSGWQTNAPVDAVTLDRPSDQEDRVTCLGATPSSPVVLIADHPLAYPGSIPYFEVTVLEGSSIIIGLLQKVRNNDGGGAPGRRPGSFGLFANGDLISTVPGCECSLPFSAPFGMLDTIGIGCLFTSRSDVRIFATHNGRDLGTILETQQSECPLYPAISFEDSGCIVTVKREKPFLFDLPQVMFESSPTSPTMTLSPSGLINPSYQSASSAPSPQQSEPAWSGEGVPLWSGQATSASANMGSPQSSRSWLTQHQTNFTSSTVGKKISRMFSAPGTRSSRLEADLLEAQEHISVLATVLTEQNERQQHDLLKELTVSCRKLLVRHANLVREATDDEALNRILALNDRLIELLASADRILDNSSGAPPKTVAPSNAEPILFGGINLVARGTADTVSEMLYLLRSGTTRSQKNAVQCLARLVREPAHNDMVVINGGIHAFVTLTKLDSADDELRKLAARALAELASWVRISALDDSMATTRAVFKTDLDDVMRTLELIVEDDPLLVAQAVSNIILLLTTAKLVCNSILNDLSIPIILKILAMDMDQLLSPTLETPLSLARQGTHVHQQQQSLPGSNSAHRRASSWTPQSSPEDVDMVRKAVFEDVREASRIGAFGLSLLIRRCDSARTVVVNNSLFFPILEKLLLANDEELLLHAVSIVKGLLCPSLPTEDEFSQGFITARVLQSPIVLQNLFRLCRRPIAGSVRHHLVAAVAALVEHKHVLRVFLEIVSTGEVLDALLIMVSQVLRNSERNAGMHTESVTSMVIEESSFFNAHFKQQQSELMSRDKRTRTKLAELRVLHRSQSVPKRHSSNGLLGSALTSTSSLSSMSAFKEPGRAPSILWELSSLSSALLKVIIQTPSSSSSSSFLSASSSASLSMPSSSPTLALTNDQFESIVVLSQLDSVHEDSDSRIDADEEENAEMFREVLRNASSILVVVAERFRIPDARLVASALMSLTGSPDRSVKEKAMRAMAEAVNNVREIAAALVAQDCAVKLCEDKQASGVPLRALVCSTLQGLATEFFLPTVSLENSLESMSGFGPNDVVLRFLLDSLMRFDADPEAACESCRALTIICASKSALAVHYRSSLMKRSFFSLALMSNRCESVEARKAAEELFKVCGFSQGALQVVANDPFAIKEWASVKVDLEVAHALVDVAIRARCAMAWLPDSHSHITNTLLQGSYSYEERVDGLRVKLISTAANLESSGGVRRGGDSSGGTTPYRKFSKTPDSRGSSSPASPMVTHMSDILAEDMQSTSTSSATRATTTTTMPGSASREGPASIHHKLLSAVSEIKQAPPSKWLEKVAHGLGHAETYDKLLREVSLSAEGKTAKLTSLFRALSGAPLSTKPLMDYQLACIEARQMVAFALTASQADSLAFDGVEHCLPPTLKDLLTRIFWGNSSVQRYLATTPIGFLFEDEDVPTGMVVAKGPPRPGVGTLAHASSTHLELPLPLRFIRLQSNVNFWTEKLVRRVVADNAAQNKALVGTRWGLALSGSALGESEDDKNRLIDLLYSLPSIVSLTFSGKAHSNSGESTLPSSADILSRLDPVNRLASVVSSVSSQGSADSSAGGELTGSPVTATVSQVREQEERLAQLMVNLPSSVAWISFDRDCTSPEGLRLVSAFLGVRADLVGCAVTNSSYTLDEMSDLLRYMSRSAAVQTLRFVDFSGCSALGDIGAAAVVKTFVGTKLSALDLSGIKMGGGQATVDALLGVTEVLTSTSLGRDARGEAKVLDKGLLASSSLRFLGLARCGLSGENASRLLYALSKRGNKLVSMLRVLDLDKNNLKGLRQPLVSFLAFGTSVREFGFAENEITPFVSDVARALSSNKTMQIFRYTHAQSNANQFSSYSPTSLSMSAMAIGGAQISSSPSPSKGEPGGISSATSAALSSTAQPDPRVFVRMIEQALKRNRLEWLESRTSASNAGMMPPSPRRLQSGSDIEEDDVESILSKGLTSDGYDKSKRTMNVLFSSPLVWRDESGKLHPVDALDCDAERQILTASFEEAMARNGGGNTLEVTFNMGCTSETLISVLTRKPTAVHLSSHGEETYIAMEDGKGGMHALGIEHLEEICRAADVGHFLKLVFVSACNSLSIATAFIKSGVSAVVAVDSKISDKAAQVFTRAFYLSIALGDPIVTAFNLGREAVRASPLLSEASQHSGKNFILMGEGKDSVCPRAKQALMMSTRMPQGKMFSGVEFPDTKKWRLMDAKFLEVLVPGRNVDAYLIIVALTCKRVVTVLAPEGFGKSAVLSGFVCKYVNERRIFEDGCVVLDLTTCKTVADVQAKLIRVVRKPRTRRSSLQSTTSLSQLQNQSSSSSNAGDHLIDEEDDEDELERTLTELSKRRCVLIMDHMDQILEESFDQVRFFLGHLLDRTKGLRIVIATRSSKAVSIPGHDDVVHTLGPLSFLDSARLFLKCCPHYHNDVHARPRQGAPPPINFEQGLARHPLCAEMNGVSKTIVQKASVITYEQWLELVDEVTAALMNPPFAETFLFPPSPKSFSMM